MSSTPLPLLLLVFLLLNPNVIPADETRFVPSQPEQQIIHFRPLRDILFQPGSVDVESPVVLASFRPEDPSPTLASPPLAGVSKIRFLESDAFFVPPYTNHPATEIATSVDDRNEELSGDIIPAALIRQAKSAQQDRWPWPSSSPRLTEQSQGRTPLTTTVNLNSPPSPLIIKKSVAKPYRLLPRTSSCPKLLHDLNISCSLPKQHFGQPVVFQWYKTQYNSAAAANNFLDSSIKVPIAYGTHILNREIRYGITSTDDAATLTIRQLKVDDCGRYVCEALNPYNATILSSSEFLIFLCY